MLPTYRKYNSRKALCRLDHKHDSAKEAMRCNQLQMNLQGKVISNLAVQVPFEVMSGFRWKGEAIRAIKYVADFVYTENGKMIIEDCKGMRTDVYKIKRKLLIAHLLSEGVEFDFIET